MQYNRGSVDPQRAVEYKFQILKKKKKQNSSFLVPCKRSSFGFFPEWLWNDAEYCLFVGGR